MLIETTINIRLDALIKLSRAAAITGRSRRTIISALLRRFANERAQCPAHWKRVSYQRPAPKEDWRRMHLLLNPDEYEFFQDLRKVFKKSISACVAEAIDRYLDEIFAIKNIDNYRYRNYSFARVIVDDVICWILSWGVPARPLTQLPL